jgi:DNA polymerase-3 subunit delta
MKITYKQLAGFVKAPDKAARVILLYGPERGLLSERLETIGKTVCPDLIDPFNVIKLTAAQITDDPARLLDETQAISMMGGNRLIIITDAGNTLTTVIKSYLKEASADNLVLIEGGELDARSSLRLACEKAKNAAALPCYVESAQDLAGVIRQKLQELDITAERDALTYLSQNLTGNRSFMYGELEKIALYVGALTDDAQKPYTLQLDTARFVISDGGNVDYDDLIYALCDGDKDTALGAFDRLVAEGVAVISVQRGLQRHFKRLLITKERVLNGARIFEAAKMLKPPLFFKVQDQFMRQVQNWSKPRLVMAIQRLNDVEAKCKKTGYNDVTLTAQTILALAR